MTYDVTYNVIMVSMKVKTLLVKSISSKILVKMKVTVLVSKSTVDKVFTISNLL